MSASGAAAQFSISIPPHEPGGHDQDAEWCWVRIEGEPERRIRFHDYPEIYQVPGLYERLFYDELRCDSPATVCGLLADVLDQRGQDASELRVLDLGAGSGMVAEQLGELGASHLVGIDIIDEARQAAERDRPGIYDGYVVADMCDPDPDVHRALLAAEANCLTSVAALGFGDIPPSAFANTFNYVATGGLIAFNLRDRFLKESDRSGYRLLIDRMISDSVIRPLLKRRYRHRFSTAGEPLYYFAVVAEKLVDVPARWV
jgi:SAM-dependent methyltransferase